MTAWCANHPERPAVDEEAISYGIELCEDCLAELDEPSTPVSTAPDSVQLPLFELPIPRVSEESLRASRNGASHVPTRAVRQLALFGLPGRCDR
jgi:hypothetical protein